MKLPAVSASAVVLLVLITASAGYDRHRSIRLLMHDVLIQSHRLTITFNRNDATQTAAFYSRGAVFNHPGLPTIIGRRNIRELYKGFFFHRRPYLEVLSTHVSLLGRRHYVTNSTYRITETLETGRSQRMGSFNLIWVFFGARPYVVNDFTTTDMTTGLTA